MQSKNMKNLLVSNRDKYALSPCDEDMWFVLGLSEDIKVPHHYPTTTPLLLPHYYPTTTTPLLLPHYYPTTIHSLPSY